MRRLLPLILSILFLFGCNGKDAMDDALALRHKILQASACSFTVLITADYGDVTYSFAMDSVADEKGNITFTVSAPETIAGITGKLTADGGSLTFDDVALAIPMLTDDQITPVSAPWILMRTLRGGYITSCTDGRITIDDSYDDDALKLDITLNGEKIPSFVEIYWKNRRILTLEVKSFVLS